MRRLGRLPTTPFVGKLGGHFLANLAQEVLHLSGIPWVNLLRNFDESEIGKPDVTTNGTSEISMRNQYRAWARYMTLTMDGGV